MSRSTEISNDQRIPGPFVVRNVRPSLSGMAWGGYSIEVSSCFSEKAATDCVALIVLPATTDLELADAALNGLTPTHVVGHFFTGRYGHTARSPDAHVFSVASPCVVIDNEKAEDPLALARVLLGLLNAKAALVVYPAISEFHVIERRE